MSDTKISQLTSTTSLESADLLPVSKSIVGGNWESKSISAANMYKSFGGGVRTLKVSKSGVRDADTLVDAMALAVALTPTQANPVVIQVMPGAYTENNPINIPAWVSVYSEGSYYSASVTAANDGDIFVGVGSSELNGFTIIGLLGFSNIAYKSTSSTNGTISNCIIQNCYTGILSDNGSINAVLISGLSYQRVFEKFISSINGGFLSATSCNVVGILTRPVNAYYCYGLNSELYLFSSVCSNCVNGLYSDNYGYSDVLGFHMEDCDNSIHMGAVGNSHIKFMGGIIEDSVINDVFVESVSSRLAYMGHLDSSKFSIVNGAETNIMADDENVDGGLIVGKSSLQGKVSIGTPGAIALGEDLQVNIGEGSAFVNDKQGNEIAEYWSFDNSAASGSKFTRFANNAGTQLTSANDAIVIGCRYPFPAIILEVGIALVTANYITTEYWDGSSWVDLGTSAGGGVAGYKRSDFTPRANEIFRNVEAQFVEFSSVLFSNGDWSDDNDVLDQIPAWDSGEDFYAIRFRNNGALTSGMTFQSGMIKPHSFMVSTSGKKANFGLYRTTSSLYIDSKLFYPDSVNPPTYIDLQMSTNITFTNNPVCPKANPTSKVAVAFIMPFDIDTSSPLECWVDGVVNLNDPGKDIASTIYMAVIDVHNPGVVGALPETSWDQATTVTGAANTFTSIYQPIDISAFHAEDLLLVAFERNTTDPLVDTYSGDFILGDIVFKYKRKFV